MAQLNLKAKMIKKWGKILLCYIWASGRLENEATFIGDSDTDYWQMIFHDGTYCLVQLMLQYLTIIHT